MKKSIFLFFAAILCAIGMNAATWTVAGDKEIVNGTTAWKQDETKNDLTNVSGTKWGLLVENKTLSKTSYYFKITQDHAWTTAYPSSNYNFAIGAAGTYNIIYRFNTSGNSVGADYFKTWTVAGSGAVLTDDWKPDATANDMTRNGNTFEYVLTKKDVKLEKGTTYECKVCKDHAWTKAYPGSNHQFSVATTGYYDVTFKFNVATETVDVTTTLINCKVTTSANPTEGGSVTATKEYAKGSSVTLTATPAEGYEFVNWTKEGTVVSTSETYSFTVLEDVSLVANFKVPIPDVVKYQVTVSANDNTMGNVTGGGEYEEGATALLTATPNSGYLFKNWTVAGAEVSTANPYTFTVDADITVTANFEELPKVTVYAINSVKWDAIAVHHWHEDGAGTEWPGELMINTGEKAPNGFDVYTATFLAEHENCIFNNNGNGSQTATLDVRDGQYYDLKSETWYASLAEVPLPDPLATDVFLAGSMNGWSTTANEFKKVEEGSATATLTMNLEAETEYEFKVVREGAWTSSKDNSKITGSVSELVFSSSVGDNTMMTTTVAGDYVFTWNDSKLSITYPASTEPDPTPDPAETETVYFVNADDWTGTISAYAYSPENAAWPGVAATKETYQIAGHDVYSYTAEKGKYANVIFTNKNDGDKQTADLTWTAGKYYVNYGSVTGWFTKEEAESKLAAPAENVYTIVGDLVGGWDVNATQYDMQATGNANEYVLTLTNQTIKKGTYDYKVVCNHAWGTGDYPTSGNQQGNIPEDGVYTLIFTYVVGTSLTVDAQKTGDATIEAKYYIAGELPGTAWDPKSFEMTANGSIYSATFENVPAATYSFRVTSGNWNPSWGYSHMEGVYSEISQGDNDNNFKLTLTKATTFTVKFDSENEKITFEDLTAVAVDAVTAFIVTVPAGTEKCYIVGDFAESNWSTFIEMDKVVGEDNKFTLEVGAGKKIASATTVNQYKYTCGEDWMYVEDIADNRTWTNNDNVTAWQAIPGVVVDLSNQPATLYFRPNTNWKVDNARFAAYFFGTEEKWADMTDSNSDGIYEVANDKANANVIFCRMNPSAAENKWENKWNQTCDIVIPNEAENLNTVWTPWKNVFEEREDDKKLYGIWAVPETIGSGDNSAFYTKYSGQTINVIVERTFEKEVLHTLCLPFSLPAGWIGTAYQLSGVQSNNAEELVLYVKECSTFEAGKPYIVEPTNDELASKEYLLVDNVTISTTLTPNSVSNQTHVVTLKGILNGSGQTDGAIEYYIGTDGALHKEATNKLALRSIVEITDKSGNPVGVRARVAFNENVETGVEDIIATDAPVKVIVNGQLIIIRDGVKYNVQGQKL